MAYLVNNNFVASDSYTVSGSFWFYAPTTSDISNRIIDSLAISTDAYGFEYDNIPFNLSILQTGTTVRQLIWEFNQPTEYIPSDQSAHIEQEYWLQEPASFYLADPGQLTLPNLPGDSHAGQVGDVSKVGDLVTRVTYPGGTGFTPIDTDFSSATRGITQEWPPPSGTTASIPVVSLTVHQDASPGNDFADVIYEGPYQDVTTRDRKHFFKTASNSYLVNAWNHCAFSVNNQTSAHLWIVDGINKTGSFVNFDNNVIIPWQIQFSGAKAYMPSNRSIAPGGTDAQTVMRFSDFQLWSGQYIDWSNSNNFAKVVTITGGIGRPTNTNMASAAFGLPAILFKGDSSTSGFRINRGTGGSFSKIGTLSNFTPGPSY